MTTVPAPDPFAGFPALEDLAAFVDMQAWRSRPVDDLQHLVWGRWHAPLATHRWAREITAYSTEWWWVPFLVCGVCQTMWETTTDPRKIKRCVGARPSRLRRPR